MRSTIDALEKKVKDNFGDPMPAWFTQQRDWRTIDDHLRVSRFRVPKEGCAERYREIRERR